MSCKFIKYFKEPTKKYNCFSVCLFYKDKYLKTTKNFKIFNATEFKINIFYNNLLAIDKYLNDGTYPDNFYLRLYYDDSIYKIDKYVKIIDILKKNSKVQLIKYDCNKLKLNKTHINLFGAIIRFYTIFDNESKNMQYSIMADADNIFTSNFFEIFNNFVKSKKLVYTFNNINEGVFQGNDFYENNDFYNYIYLLGGMTIVKKDKIFDKKYWNLYFDNMYEQNDLIYVYNYIDFKKYSMINVLKRYDLKIKSLYSFVYGFDEVWLNFVIKKILLLNNKINKLDVYIVKDYNLKMILNKLIDLFKFNSIVNDPFFILFLKNCFFLKNKKDYNNLEIYINNLKDEDIITFFKDISNNQYLNKLYIQNNIKYIINNIDKLFGMRQLYKFNEILSHI